jgi:mRNA interferase MazF
MPGPDRGEVWPVDLGLAAKVRPALVLSVPAGPQDRALTTVVAHTASLRGSQFEVAVPVRFLKAGGFDAQNPSARGSDPFPADRGLLQEGL